MDETSLNAKRGAEGLNSFQSVLAHDLVYWDPFSLKVALMKQNFLLGLTTRKAEQPLQNMELKEKEAQKDKAYKKSLYKEPTVNRCLLILDLKAVLQNLNN